MHPYPETPKLIPEGAALEETIYFPDGRRATRVLGASDEGAAEEDEPVSGFLLRRLDLES